MESYGASCSNSEFHTSWGSIYECKNSASIFCSEGTSKCAQIIEKKGRITMSFSVGCISPQKIYVACDSRDTIRRSNGLVLHSDNLNKIVYLKNTNVAVVTTGTNRIQQWDGGKSPSYDMPINTFVKNIDFSGVELTDCYALAKHIFTQLQEAFIKAKMNNGSVFVSLYKLCENGASYASFLVTYNNDFLFHNESINTLRDTQFFWQGEEYAGYIWNNCSMSAHYFVGADDKTVIESFNETFGKIMSPEAQNLFERYTIGGPIHIIKLTPDGYEWLQNGYDL